MRMKTSTITTSTRNDISMLQKAVSTAPKRSFQELLPWLSSPRSARAALSRDSV